MNAIVDGLVRIWIVKGTTGEYSSREEWVVCAYADEGKAKTHVEECTRWYNVHYKDNGSRRDGRPYTEPLKNPYDENMSVDYTGTSWCLEESVLRQDFP